MKYNQEAARRAIIKEISGVNFCKATDEHLYSYADTILSRLAELQKPSKSEMEQEVKAVLFEYDTIPMADEISNRLLGVFYSELWPPKNSATTYATNTIDAKPLGFANGRKPGGRRCVIDNGHWAHTLQVDGQKMVVIGDPDYFAKHYEELGYEVIRTESFRDSE